MHAYYVLGDMLDNFNNSLNHFVDSIYFILLIREKSTNRLWEAQAKVTLEVWTL